MTIALYPKRILHGLLTVFAVLLVLNLLGLLQWQFSGRELPIKIVHFDDEQNLPSLFSTANLALCGLFSGIIAKAIKGGRGVFLQWAGIAGLFFFLAIDEFMMVHERTAQVVRLVLKDPRLHYTGWIVPYLFLVGFFAVVYLRFFLKLPKSTRMYIALGALLFVGGAIGMEIIGCICWQFAHGKDMVYFLLATLEESLEMLGVISIMYALMRYISDYLPGLSINLVNDVASKP